VRVGVLFQDRLAVKNDKYRSVWEKRAAAPRSAARPRVDTPTPPHVFGTRGVSYETKDGAAKTRGKRMQAGGYRFAPNGILWEVSGRGLSGETDELA